MDLTGGSLDSSGYGEEYDEYDGMSSQSPASTLNTDLRLSTRGNADDEPLFDLSQLKDLDDDDEEGEDEDGGSKGAKGDAGAAEAARATNAPEATANVGAFSDSLFNTSGISTSNAVPSFGFSTMPPPPPLPPSSSSSSTPSSFHMGRRTQDFRRMLEQQIKEAAAGMQSMPPSMAQADDAQELSRRWDFRTGELPEGIELVSLGEDEAFLESQKDESTCLVLPRNSCVKVNLNNTLPPSGGGANLNEYTITMDVKLDKVDNCMSLLQTNATSRPSEGEAYVYPGGGVGIFGTHLMHHELDTKESTR
mgnify:CR=1 FL=1